MRNIAGTPGYLLELKDTAVNHIHAKYIAENPGSQKEFKIVSQPNSCS